MGLTRKNDLEIELRARTIIPSLDIAHINRVPTAERRYSAPTQSGGLTMCSSKELIHQRVLKSHEAHHIVDVHSLAAELQEHCSEMTIEEITAIIGTHVATIRAAAVWRCSAPG